MNKFINTNKIKEDLLTFTQTGVDEFIKENPALTFYAFAYDCNAEYGEVNLCFNTEEEFAKTLEEYQNSEYSQYYQTEKDIRELKYNTGDWEYQCFDTMYIMTEEEMAKLYPEIEPQINDFISIFCETLLDFTLTKEYDKIPKNDDFKVLCLDHDDDLKDAEKRLKKIKENYLKCPPQNIKNSN
jgi:hypothetical protein